MVEILVLDSQDTDPFHTPPDGDAKKRIKAVLSGFRKIFKGRMLTGIALPDNGKHVKRLPHQTFSRFEMNFVHRFRFQSFGGFQCEPV